MPPSGWERLFPARIRRRSVAREVDSEIAFHLEMRVQEFV